MPLNPSATFRRLSPAGFALLLPLASAGSAAAACTWREPARIYPEGVRWACVAVGWTDGDTLTARCGDQAGTVAVRLRGVDTAERGQAAMDAAGWSKPGCPKR